MMKKVTFLVLAFGLTVWATEHFWRGKILNPDEVGKRWGKTQFNAETFKNGDVKIRASMAYSLLVDQSKFKGKFVTDIRSILGTPDGFYFSDVFPAYLIQRAKNQNEEAWQIVFLLDNKRNVERIIVHKNCCD